ncbi:MAG TPA: HAD family phosphatase [Phycisphaerae bacterium]|nr:HAD family phosphatase [Phycisphaerae bacterium]
MAREQLAVIFDMDGVLVDSYRAHLESWQRMASEYGVEITERQFAATFGRTSRDIIARFWGEGLSDERIAEMDGRKEELYRQTIAADFPEMDGARELIRALHSAGWKLAVGSSGPPENVQAAMAGLGLPECFDAAVTGMDVTHGKPDPQVFLLAAERLGIPPCRCAVIEDAPAGIEAARRAGMVAIAITGTAPRGKLADADMVVDSLRELTPNTIARLIG